MFCTSCGQPVEAGSRFCTACGAQAGSDAAPAPPPAAMPSQPPPAAMPPSGPANGLPVMPLAGTTSNAGTGASGASNAKIVAGGIGGVVLGLIVLGRVAMHLFGSSVPSCDDSDVIKLVREILDENGAKGAAASGFDEVSMDSKAQVRSCKAIISSDGTDDVIKLSYTVEWGDKAAGKFVVSIKEVE